MKKRIVRLPAIFCLAVLLVSLLSVSALAAGDGQADASFLDKMYDWFAETFASITTYFTAVVHSITESPASFVKFAVLFGALALVLAAVVILIVSVFKRRFFRTLAGLAIAATLIWVVTFVLVLVKALEIGLPFFESCNIAFYRAMPEIYLSLEPLVDHHVALLAGIYFSLVLSILLISWLFILTANQRRALSLAQSRAAFEERLNEVLAEASAAAEEPAEEEETAPIDSEPALDETEPAVEDAEFDEVSEVAAESETVASVEEVAEEREDAPEEEELPPSYPLLDEPVFMPVPSDVFDTVDFTDADRDGYETRCGISADEADGAMSDELAEDLTAFVYREESGETAEIGLDCLNANFKEYAYIDAKILRILGLIPANARRIAVVACGKVDKPLMIEATEISLDAVKMITLAGGRAIRVL